MYDGSFAVPPNPPKEPRPPANKPFNLYRVLGIRRGARKSEIKKAFKATVKATHPDHHPNDPLANQKTAKVNEAKEVLLERPSAKQEHDSLLQEYDNECKRLQEEHKERVKVYGDSLERYFRHHFAMYADRLAKTESEERADLEDESDAQDEATSFDAGTIARECDHRRKVRRMWVGLIIGAVLTWMLAKLIFG